MAKRQRKARASGATVPDAWRTLPGRLRWAIDRLPKQGRRRGLRLFVARMQERARELERKRERALTGVYLSSIQGYVSGDVDPPLYFLEQAADVLGVRLAWLNAGEGAATEEEERIWRDAKAQVSEAWRALEHRLRSAKEKGLREGFPAFDVLPHAVRTAVLRSYQTYEDYQTHKRRYGDVDVRDAHDVVEALAKRFGSYLGGVFELLELDPEKIGEAESALIITALLQPIAIASEMLRYPSQEED
jgi:hypothetical protein